MRKQRPWYHKSVLMMAPGALVALFAMSSIVLPVGSDGLGSQATTPLAAWACDIHDGFWQGGLQSLLMTDTSDPEHRRARQLCLLGDADEAMALYHRIGVRSIADYEAIYSLNERLVMDAKWDVAERTAVASDKLLRSGLLRNNLAWHYTQANLRPAQALNLALASVADARDVCNVDTLAWAYYRDGQLAVARGVAKETLAFPATSGLRGGNTERAKESSRRLMALIDAAARRPAK
ncbi:MAG: hypothetical protein HZB16_08145 [Armatimonadetes bacterium]|nr:hypothetical protein [Armatimonadota bacterium]